MVTRITKLENFNNILAGRDLANVFEDGHVYSVNKILGQIILTDLGKHAKMENFKMLPFHIIMMDGSYCLTEEEYNKQLER